MNFEWDSKKSESNQEKHGIDFETAQWLWQDEFRIEIQAPHPIEDRWIILGKLNGKIWAAVYTVRGDAVRIISARRARKKEVRMYEG
jgi:hypothetical protein